MNTETGCDGLPPEGRPGIAARLLLLAVSAYRLLLAPLIGGFCRFEPSCSRYAEEAFLRTRRELAEHTDAISAREQLLAQRERELDEREDGWGGPDLHELESRLRRLETQRQAAQAGSFSGGFRRLEQEGTRHPPSQ